MGHRESLLLELLAQKLLLSSGARRKAFLDNLTLVARSSWDTLSIVPVHLVIALVTIDRDVERTSAHKGISSDFLAVRGWYFLGRGRRDHHVLHMLPIEVVKACEKLTSPPKHVFFGCELQIRVSFKAQFLE